MNGNPFEHFKTPDDYARWDNYIKLVRSSADLTARTP
jgi:hypothetical protein